MSAPRGVSLADEWARRPAVVRDATSPVEDRLAAERSYDAETERLRLLLAQERATAARRMPKPGEWRPRRIGGRFWLVRVDSSGRETERSPMSFGRAQTARENAAEWNREEGLVA